MLACFVPESKFDAIPESKFVVDSSKVVFYDEESKLATEYKRERDSKCPGSISSFHDTAIHFFKSALNPRWPRATRTPSGDGQNPAVRVRRTNARTY